MNEQECSLNDDSVQQQLGPGRWALGPRPYRRASMFFFNFWTCIKRTTYTSSIVIRAMIIADSFAKFPDSVLDCSLRSQALGELCPAENKLFQIGFV